MPCVISSPSTDSGKTTLSLLISCWAFSKGIKIQTFKVGPDYLDQQQLSSIGQPTVSYTHLTLPTTPYV